MLTKLQAINEMLTAVGETAVLTTVEGASDTVNAETVLDAETLKVLSKGWHANTDENVTLSPDVDGFINVPTNALQIDPVDRRIDLVSRGGRLWNRTDNTDIFDAPVVVKIIRALPFEDLPYPLQARIVAQAILKYQRAYVGSKQLDDFNREELGAAEADARDAEVESDDYNILDNADALPFVGVMSGRRVLL